MLVEVECMRRLIGWWSNEETMANRNVLQMLCRKGKHSDVKTSRYRILRAYIGMPAKVHLVFWDQTMFFYTDTSFRHHKVSYAIWFPTKIGIRCLLLLETQYSECVDRRWAVPPGVMDLSKNSLHAMRWCTLRSINSSLDESRVIRHIIWFSYWPVYTKWKVAYIWPCILVGHVLTRQ